MKKIAIIFLAAAMALTLFACSGDAKLQRGTIEGDVYKNEFVGVKFTKPSEWVYSTDEEIAEIMDVTADMMEQNSFQQKATELSTVYDMMVADPNTGSNLNIVFENLTLTGGASADEKEYFEAFKKTIESQIAGAYTFGDLEEMTLGGTKFYRSLADVNMSGMELEQAVYLKKQGSHMIVISMLSMDGTPFSDFEAMFTGIDK